MTKLEERVASDDIASYWIVAFDSIVVALCTVAIYNTQSSIRMPRLAVLYSEKKNIVISIIQSNSLTKILYMLFPLNDI